MLLITRPQPQAEDTARIFASLGYSSLIQPCVSYNYHANAEATIHMAMCSADAVIITSRFALSALAAYHALRDIALFVTGERLAHYAREAGFSRVIHANGDVNSMIHNFSDIWRTKYHALHYFHGSHVTIDLTATLRAQDIAISAHEIYYAEPVRQLSNEVMEALSNDVIDTVLLYSRHTAECATRLFAHHDMMHQLKNTRVCCISNMIAQVLQADQWKSILVAPSPSPQDICNTLAARS